MKDSSTSPNLWISLFRLLIGGVPAPFNGKEDIEFSGNEEFRFYYKFYIKKHITDFENKRIAALKELRFRLIIGIPAFILICALFIQLIENFVIILVVISMVFNTVGFWIIKPVDSYKKSVKGLIFPKIFKFFGDSFYYSPYGMIDRSSFSNSKIIPQFDEENSRDNVIGEYKGINIELLNSVLRRRESKGKYRVVFSGLLITLSLHKSFTHSTLIRTDLGALGNWVCEKFSDLDRVSLEDVRFEKNFEVYSSNQIEARYLLTTSFMERLLSLSKVFGNHLQASFFDNKLLLMIPNTNPKGRFFLTSIFTPATFNTEINEIIKEMKGIFSIINTLKLDSKLTL